MPRAYELTWDKKLHYWVKVISGKKYYFGKGATKADHEAYQSAVREYRRRLPLIMSGSESSEGEKRDVQSSRNLKATNPRRQVRYAVNHYLRHIKERVSDGEISLNWEKSARTSINHFVRFVGETYPLAQVNEGILNEYNVAQRKLREPSKTRPAVSPHTIALRFAVLKNWLRYCWSQRLIQQLPRNMATVLRTSSPSPDKPVIFEWSARGGREIQRVIEACREKDDFLYMTVLVALNTGAGLKDIMDIRTSEFRWRSSDHLRLERRRSKSGQWGSHILWSETIRMLKAFTDPMAVYNSSDRLLRLPNKSPINSGYTTQALPSVAHRFKQVVRSLFKGQEAWKVNRSFKTLRKTGANYVARRERGLEVQYLSHSATSMSDKFYTRVSHNSLDRVLCWMEEDFGLTDKLVPRYKEQRERSYEQRMREDELEPSTETE